MAHAMDIVDGVDRVDGVDTRAPWHVQIGHRAAELADFCVVHGGKAFAGWLPKTLWAYCYWHLFEKTCFVARRGGKIAGVLFAWPMNERVLRDRAEAGEAPFDWRRPAGPFDCHFTAEVVTSEEGMLRELLRKTIARYPDWESKKLFTYRGGRLIEIPHELATRLIKVVRNSRGVTHGR